jgi:hypothetical protein
MLDADLLIASLAEILPDLPALVGSEWPACEAALLIRLRALEAATPATREQACDALLEVVDAYPAARERLLLAYSARAEPVRRGGATARPRVSGAVPHARYLEIPVFYATDRAPAAEPGQPPFFTGDRSNPAGLRFGIVNVSVPDDHRKGTLDKPRDQRHHRRGSRAGAGRGSAVSAPRRDRARARLGAPARPGGSPPARRRRPRSTRRCQ